MAPGHMGTLDEIRKHCQDRVRKYNIELSRQQRRLERLQKGALFPGYESCPSDKAEAGKKIKDKKRKMQTKKHNTIKINIAKEN